MAAGNDAYYEQFVVLYKTNDDGNQFSHIAQSLFISLSARVHVCNLNLHQNITYLQPVLYVKAELWHHKTRKKANLFHLSRHTNCTHSFMAGDIIDRVHHWLIHSHWADQSHSLVAAGGPASLHFMNEDFPDGRGGAGWMNGEGGRKERSEGMEEGWWWWGRVDKTNGGRMKRGGDESHLWPRALRSTFYSGHALLCVCVCAWWHVQVVSLLRSDTLKTVKWCGHLAITEQATGRDELQCVNHQWKKTITRW